MSNGEITIALDTLSINWKSRQIAWKLPDVKYW
jgi:hypothetical protein